MSVSGRGVRWSINGIPIDFAQVHSTNTVGGRNPAPVEVGSLSRYLQGILHPRWCRISSINSIIDLQLVNMVPTKSPLREMSSRYGSSFNNAGVVEPMEVAQTTYITYPFSSGPRFHHPKKTGTFSELPGRN